MKKFKSVVVLGMLLFSAWAWGQELNLVNSKSELIWTGKAAFNSYSLTGTLKYKNAKMIIENNLIKSLSITVDMTSLDHENQNLTHHLKSKDFFEVNTFNTAIFVLDQPKKITSSRIPLKGTLKIKDFKHSKEVMAFFTKEEELFILSFSTSIDRTKYGVKFNSPSYFKKLKDQAIADCFELKGKLKFEVR